MTVSHADCLKANTELMDVLGAIRACGLPQGAVFAGAVFQTIWNVRLGLNSNYGIHDYDVIYFENDLSWEAEDRWIRRLARHLPDELRDKVEVRNQARVHLWFRSRFGRDYPPLASADDALGRALATIHAVSVRLETQGDLVITAPLGFDDIDAMRYRAGPGGKDAAVVEMKAHQTLARWPHATFDPRPYTGAVAVMPNADVGVQGESERGFDPRPSPPDLTL